MINVILTVSQPVSLGKTKARFNSHAKSSSSTVKRKTIQGNIWLCVPWKEECKRCCPTFGDQKMMAGEYLLKIFSHNNVYSNCRLMPSVSSD